MTILSGVIHEHMPEAEVVVALTYEFVVFSTISIRPGYLGDPYMYGYFTSMLRRILDLRCTMP